MHYSHIIHLYHIVHYNYIYALHSYIFEHTRHSMFGFIQLLYSSCILYFHASEVNYLYSYSIYHIGLVIHLKIIFMQFCIFGQQGLHAGSLPGLSLATVSGWKTRELGKSSSLTFVALCLSFLKH